MGKKSGRLQKTGNRREPLPAVTVGAPAVWLSVFLILGIGFLIYSNTFGCSFHFDDETSIWRNPHIQRLSSVGNIWKFWPTRFLTYLSFAINYQVGHTQVFGYHVVNLLIHLGCACCVWWLVILMSRTRGMEGRESASAAPWIALFAGLIFVCHPVQTQGVTYITQRAVSMAAFFYLFSLCAYVRGWRWISLVSALAAVYSKEMAVTLPFVIWITDRMFLAPEGKTRWKRFVPYVLIVCLIPLTMIVTRSVDIIHMHRVEEPVPNISAYHYFVTELRVMITYLRLLFVPVHQMLDYDYPLYNSIFLGPTFGGLAVVTALILWAFSLRRRWPLVAFGIFWFFITVAPESSFIPIRDLIFEHRLYLPMIGFAIFLPACLYQAVGRRDMRWMIGPLTLFVGVCCVLTYQRNFVWKDETTMWNDTLKKAPSKSRGYKGLGFEFEKKGELDRALAEYDKALQLNPYFDEVYYNKANIYASRKQYDLAMQHYNRAIEINPKYAIAYHNRGLLHAMTGDDQKAIQDLNEAIALKSDYTLAYRNRGYYYAKRGDFARALADYDKAVSLDPGYPEAYSERGAAYAGMREYARAVADYEKAISLNLRTADIYNNLGFAYYAMGSLDAAIKNLSIAIQINPDFVTAYHNRGQAYGVKGENQRALADFNKAIALDPRFGVAYRNRGMVEAVMGDVDKALEDFTRALELKPDYGLAYADRAMALASRGAFARAWEDVQRARELGFPVDEKFAQEVKQKAGRT